MKPTQVFAYIIGCLFSICLGVGIFILFAVTYESMHTTGVKAEDAAPHDYVEVDLSDPENVSIKSCNGYSARDEYTLDRWQTEEGVIAVTIYFEEADNEKKKIKRFTDKMLGGVVSGIVLGATLFGISIFLLNQITPGGLWPPREEEPTRPDFETHLHDNGDMRISAYNGYKISEYVIEEQGDGYILLTVLLEKEPET